jgi:uncharacterized membrane protein YdbT with pleckstrin-like domain
MNYAEKNLNKGEEVVFQAKIHWASLIVHVVLMFGIIGFITIIPGLIRMFTTVLAITNKKIIGKTGLINTKSMDSPLNKINNIGIEQGLFGKILGFGTITITTSSGSYVFKCIANPGNFKNLVNHQIDVFDEDRINKQAEKLASSISGAISK